MGAGGGKESEWVLERGGWLGVWFKFSTPPPSLSELPAVPSYVTP